MISAREALERLPAGPHDHDALHAQHMEMCRQMMSQGGMMGAAEWDQE
jgi:hypothetical protein